MADGDDVTLTNVQETGRAVHRHVLVPLLETSVFGNVLQVIPSHHYRALHLVGDDHGLEDAAADRDVAGEGALLVDVGALLGLLGGLEAQTDALLVVPHALLGLLSQHLCVCVNVFV